MDGGRLGGECVAQLGEQRRALEHRRAVREERVDRSAARAHQHIAQAEVAVLPDREKLPMVCRITTYAMPKEDEQDPE